MAEPVLDLDTLVERKPVRIDGKMYEMLNPGELSLFDLHKFGVQGEALELLKGAARAGVFSDEQLKTVSASLDAMVRLILRAPDDVLARLTDVHKFRIVSAFNALTQPTLPDAAVSEATPGAAPVEENPDPSTGERS